MKTLTLETENLYLSLEALAEMVVHGTVIVTQNDQPLFAVVPVEEDDIQTWQLGENPEFLELMRRSWERLHTEGSLPLAEARRRLL